MLRFTETKSAADVKAYYLEGSMPFRADYYLENEGIGFWGGLGSERLGLKGRIERHPFEALADNRHPVTGDRLTLRDKTNRRIGYDVTFNVPKSVSLAWAFGKDNRIIELIQDAAKRTMDHMEQEAEARVRKESKDPKQDPKITERITGELNYATFTHLTARPPKGSDVPDPLLHVHAFIFNNTFDSEEMQFKAVDIARMKRDAPYYQAIFHSYVAKGLQDLGYGITRKGGRHVAGYEVEGISRELIEKFSLRDQEIRREIKRLGIVDPAKKARMAERTRSKKKVGRYTLGQLQTLWRERLSIEDLAGLAFMRRAPKAPEITPEAAMDHAVEHSFDRHATVRARELVRQSLKLGAGSVTKTQAEEAFSKRPWYHDTDRWGRSIVSTPEMRSLEGQIVNFAKNGQGYWSPLGPKNHTFDPIDGVSLSKEQKEAAREVLASTNRVTFLAGKAGVGKTTTMRHIEAAMNKIGRRLVPLAPSAKAARGVLQKEGFHEANTVAAFFENDELKRKAFRQTIWVDEASLLGTKDYHKLFGLAQQLKARVLLTGDPMQHKAVQAGDVLTSLVNNHGVKPIELSAIRRQRGKYLQVVEHFSRGETVEGLERLEQMGGVIEIGTDERYARMAKDYAKVISQGKTALAVAPTKAEGREVTAWIREQLREEGAIAGTDREFTYLSDQQLTNAEKRQASSYELGDVIQFQRQSEHYGRGTRLTVVGLEENKILVTAPGRDGKVRAFEPKHAEYVGVYRPQEVGLARGDLVMITQNTRSQDGRTRLDNGSMATIQGFKSNGDIQLKPLARDNKKAKGLGRLMKPKTVTLDGDNGFLNHAYCVTSHKGQGDTVDHVLVAQSMASAPAGSEEQIYTSVSRGRLSCRIYTDDQVGLRRAVQRSESVKSALELASFIDDGARERVRVRDALKHIRESSPARVNTRPLAKRRERPKHWPLHMIRKLRGGPSHER